MNFYPISLIDKLVPSKFDRTLVDPFEDGSSTMRRTWPSQYFKRKWQLTHSPMTAKEWSYLRSFFAQNGTAGVFWFRDNVHRDGNAQVRFASQLQPTFQGSARLVTIELEEVAPIRALPDLDDITTAAGSAPVLWWDANRELWYQHCGLNFTEPQTWDVVCRYRATWQNSQQNIYDTLSQYQRYNLTGLDWAKTAANIAELAGAQPACSLFAITYLGPIAGNNVFFSVGSGANGQLGLMVNPSGICPFLGTGAQDFSAVAIPAPDYAFRSVAAVWAAGSNAVSTYSNGVFVATSNYVRAFTAGPAALAADTAGNVNMGVGSATHLLLFNSALTADQVAAVHNLLHYQYF